MQKLARDFYLQDALGLARALVGKVLVRQTAEGVVSGRIVEAEAYMGALDAAAHSYRGKPGGRVNVQYGPGGFAYVYLIYGMHCCLNVVANAKGIPECVLIRALEPLTGLELMRRRRGKEAAKDLCSGPGKLCASLGIDRSSYGEDLCGDALYIAEDSRDSHEILQTPRINVNYAGEAAAYPWRFVEKNSLYLSVKVK